MNMENTMKMYITADEVAELLGVSRGYAYKVIRGLNDELKAKGFRVISGKVPRKYFQEKFYGMVVQKKGDDDMPATRDGKLWRSQFYYKDWQGVRRKKNKRGFKTKGEADEWERNFLQQQQKNLDISFENFVEIYFADMENRLRESTIINKRYVFDLKVTPYFKHKKMCEIQTSDIRAWQNELIKKGYAPTYLKSINNQLAALFNYAVRYYDLRDNPCRKAGSIGKSKADEMDFWTKQEFKEFLPSMDSKPEARMAFLLLYWTGMRIGELLALALYISNNQINADDICDKMNIFYRNLRSYKTIPQTVIYQQSMQSASRSKSARKKRVNAILTYLEYEKI